MEATVQLRRGDLHTGEHGVMVGEARLPFYSLLSARIIDQCTLTRMPNVRFSMARCQPSASVRTIGQ